MESNELTPEKRKQTLQFLEKEQGIYREILHEIYGDRGKYHENALNRYRDFLLKIGELSFIFGAAIVPVIIISKTEIREPIFIFLGVALYLTNGFIVLLKTKENIEKDTNQIPGLGADLEAEVLPISFSINKLIWDPTKKEHVQEYYDSQNQFVKKELAPKTASNKVSFLLDFLFANFVWASLLLVKDIWPFSDISYWSAFFVITVIIGVLSGISYFMFREETIKSAAANEKVANLRREHSKWQDREIFGR